VEGQRVSDLKLAILSTRRCAPPKRGDIVVVAVLMLPPELDRAVVVDNGAPALLDEERPF